MLCYLLVSNVNFSQLGILSPPHNSLLEGLQHGSLSPATILGHVIYYSRLNNCHYFLACPIPVRSASLTVLFSVCPEYSSLFYWQ